MRSPEINEYLKEATGDDFSAKDFRTWAATMLAAIALAVSGEVAATKTGRKRAVTRAVKEVSHYLGNTPAVCRASYIDPRVIDAYNGGLIIRGVLEEIADTDEVGRAADPPAGGRAGRARPAQRAGGVAGSGAGRGLSGGSACLALVLAQVRNSRRSAGPPVTPWTTIETITHAIAVHTTSSSSPPDSDPRADDRRGVVEGADAADAEPGDERAAARALDLRAEQREQRAERADDDQQHDREQPALPARAR